MVEKQHSAFKEGLIKIFGENSWIVTHWFSGQIESNSGLLQLQNRELLVKLLDAFPGRKDLSNPDFLRLLNVWSGVELKGNVPHIDKTAYVVGNYVGREATSKEPHFLDPTIWCLVKLFEVAADLGIDDALAVARDSVFEGMDPRLAGAFNKHMAFAKKGSDGYYTLPFREKYKLHRVAKSEKGLLWTAPAAITTMDGLKFDHLTTTSIRQAMENQEAQLLTLSMVTTEDRERAVSIELDEVKLPQVEVDKKMMARSGQKADLLRTEILREVNYQILLWAFAQTASHLPEGQRGQFEDYEQARRRILWTLRGMMGEGLIKIGGGFVGRL